MDTSMVLRADDPIVVKFADGPEKNTAEWRFYIGRDRDGKRHWVGEFEYTGTGLGLREWSLYEPAPIRIRTIVEKLIADDYGVQAEVRQGNMCVVYSQWGTILHIIR